MHVDLVVEAQRLAIAQGRLEHRGVQPRLLPLLVGVAEVAEVGDAGATFRNDIVEGPGGKQILLQDPSGNFVELFQPAAR
jgi:hypothetical protein